MAPKGLEGISNYRGPVSTTSQVFFLAEKQVVSQPEFAAFLSEHDFAHQQGLDLGEFTFTLSDESAIKTFRNQKIEYGITQEFEPFVGLDAGFVNRINEGAVLKSLRKEVWI